MEVEEIIIYVFGYLISSGILIGIIESIKQKTKLSGKKAMILVAVTTSVIAMLFDTFVPGDIKKSVFEFIVGVIGISSVLYNLYDVNKGNI